MKKLLIGILTASLLSASFVLPAFAENDISVVLNGNAIEFDVPPQIINERTMVPLRAIFEALGASVDWNGDTRTVTSTKGNTTISLTIDSPTMKVSLDGKDLSWDLDAPACIVDGRTLVPVRAISDAFVVDVEWDDATRTVNLKSYSEINYNKVFETLRDTIISKGEYRSGMYGVVHETSNSDAVLFVYEEGDGFVTLNFMNNYNDNNVSLGVFKNGTPYVTVTYAGSNLMGEFDKNTYKFVKDEEQSTISASNEKAAYDLLKTALPKYEEALKAEGFSLTLSDIGVSTDISASETAAETSDETTVNGFDAIKNGLLSSGIKSSSDGSYFLMDIPSSSEIYNVSYQPSTGKITLVGGSGPTDQAMLTLEEGKNPRLDVTKSSLGKTMYMYFCEFENGTRINQPDYSLSADTSNIFGSLQNPINYISETEAMSLTRKYLTPVITLLNSHGINVTLASLGVVPD